MAGLDPATRPGPAPPPPMTDTPDPPPAPDDEAILRLAEAMVFSSATPVTPRALSRILPEGVDSDAVLDALRARYAGRGVELAEVAGGVQFRTALDLAPALRKVIDVPRRLTRVAMETLAIVAYHQPVTRPEIEHMRGTSLSQQTLEALLENKLIAPAGRKDAPGRPTLWVTTPEFLTAFGLPDIRALPRREDLFVEPPRPMGAPAANDARPVGDGPDGRSTTPIPAGDGPDGGSPTPPLPWREGAGGRGDSGTDRGAPTPPPPPRPPGAGGRGGTAPDSSSSQATAPTDPMAPKAPVPKAPVPPGPASC